MNTKTKFDMHELVMTVYERDEGTIVTAVGKICGIILLYNDIDKTIDTYYNIDTSHSAYDTYERIREDDLISIQGYTSKDIIKKLISFGYKSCCDNKIYKEVHPAEKEMYQPFYFHGMEYLDINPRISVNTDTWEYTIPQLKDYL